MLNTKISNGGRPEVLEKTNNYLKLFPEEKTSLAKLIEQMTNNQNIFDRSNMNGHITVSGLVLDKNKKLLVVWHNQLKKLDIL